MVHCAEGTVQHAYRPVKDPPGQGSADWNAIAYEWS